MSSLHVRARMGSASAVSSLCLGLYPVACSFSRGKETWHGEPPYTLTRPQLGPCGRTQARICNPRCAPAGKIIQHSCMSRFFPRKGTEVAAHLYGGARARARTRTAPSYQGDKQARSRPAESVQWRLCCLLTQRTLPKERFAPCSLPTVALRLCRGYMVQSRRMQTPGCL